jgi:hypothetical protein
VSEENLDLVRSIVADWERGDWGSAAWAHPEIEHTMVGGLEDSTRKGLPSMAQRWGQWLSAWDEFRVAAEEYRVLDAERVLVPLRGSGRGKTSGLGMEQTHVKGAVLFCVHGDRVTRLVQYWDRDRALADLGSEE